jgi:hypothetical protein
MRKASPLARAREAVVERRLCSARETWSMVLLKACPRLPLLVAEADELAAGWRRRAPYGRPAALGRRSGRG